jgi:hypothetical protein
MPVVQASSCDKVEEAVEIRHRPSPDRATSNHHHINFGMPHHDNCSLSKPPHIAGKAPRGPRMGQIERHFGICNLRHRALLLPPFHFSGSFGAGIDIGLLTAISTNC